MDFDYGFLLDALIAKLPAKRKNTPGGWTSFNCPVCSAMGTTVDKRHRGGLKINGNGAFSLNCFNCGFSTGWRPGYTLNKKVRLYFQELGATREEIKRLNFKAWQLQNTMDPEKRAEIEEYHSRLSFNEIDLPKGAKALKFWATQKSPPEDFLKVVEYLGTRGEEIVTGWDYFWTPTAYSKGDVNFRDMRYRLIIPFYWKGQLVGWHARTSKDQRIFRYVGDTPRDYLFNCDVMELYERKYILLVEGVFDAIALDCVATFGNSLSDEQVRWINITGKEVILLHDFGNVSDTESTTGLVSTAIKNKWTISSPWIDVENNQLQGLWDKDIKDAADAVERYGRLWTLKTIMDNKFKGKTKIETFRQMVNIRS